MAPHSDAEFAMNKMQQDEKTTACGLTPKGLERQKRILDAAREVFLEQGYDNASINDIMCRAGGSLSTLYRLFGSKLGLFEAMMEQTSNQVFAAFQAFECSIKRQETPEQALKRYARLLLERVLSPEAVGLYRLITTDCSSEREQIQQLFYAQGPKRINEKLAGYLRVQEGPVPVESDAGHDDNRWRTRCSCRAGSGYISARNYSALILSHRPALMLLPKPRIGYLRRNLYPNTDGH
jgi:TetR/AcrR family transcriptional repressor of cmeABC operon